MHDLARLTARFEIAVENFFRSAFDLHANEAAYQAWYAASVIAEFGLSRVYREVHLMRTQLAELVSPETLVGFEKGNELVPDLCVSWEEAIDARHTVIGTKVERYIPADVTTECTAPRRYVEE